MLADTWQIACNMWMFCEHSKQRLAFLPLWEETGGGDLLPFACSSHKNEATVEKSIKRIALLEDVLTAAKSASMTLSTDMTWTTMCQSSLHLRAEWLLPKDLITARIILRRSIRISLQRQNRQYIPSGSRLTMDWNNYKTNPQNAKCFWGLVYLSIVVYCDFPFLYNVCHHIICVITILYRRCYDGRVKKEYWKIFRWL